MGVLTRYLGRFRYKEAYGGDAGGSSGECGGGVGAGDASEGEDGDGLSGEGGCAEQIEASAGSDFFIDDVFLGGIRCGDHFFEDGTEEDVGGTVVRRSRCGAGNLVEGVAGEADERLGQAGRGVEGANLSGGKLAGRGGEMDSVGAGGESDVGAGVDEEPGCGVVRAEGCEEAASERGEVRGGEVCFAELEEVNASGGKALGLGEERGLAGWFVSFETGAVGDGVAQHGF